MVSAGTQTVCELAMIGGGDPNIGYLVFQLKGVPMEYVLIMNAVLALLASYGRIADEHWGRLMRSLCESAREEMDSDAYRRLSWIYSHVPITLESDLTRTGLFMIFVLNASWLFVGGVVPYVL